MSAAQLILVGAPASGKTSAGRLVAERLQVPFTDTDELLADALGLSLAEAWVSLPAQQILDVETALCTAALANPGIVALGSRAVAEPRLRALLGGRQVIWLQVSATRLTRRLGMTGLGMDALAAIRRQMDALLQQREPWYEEVATLRLDTDRLDIAAVADRVGQAWEGKT